VRLLLFHVYFLENVGRPEGMSLEDIAQGYDAMYGMPSAKMKGTFAFATIVHFVVFAIIAIINRSIVQCVVFVNITVIN
jgi:hypothetical protein